LFFQAAVAVLNARIHKTEKSFLNCLITKFEWAAAMTNMRKVEAKFEMSSAERELDYSGVHYIVVVTNAESLNECSSAFISRFFGFVSKVRSLIDLILFVLFSMPINLS
jgi:hypothetical protein